MGRMLFAAIIIGGLVLSSISFGYSGGSGTAADPYQIATVSDWQQLMNTSSHWNKYFIMTADINLQGITLTPVGNEPYGGGYHLQVFLTAMAISFVMLL